MTAVAARLRVRHPSRPALVWASAGAAFVVLQGYVYTRWLLTGDPAPVGTGPDPVPADTKVWAWALQLLVPAVFAGCVVHAVRASRRRGRPAFDALLLAGWLLVYWQDHMPVLLRGCFFYSSYLVNVSSWAPHVPGWVGRGDDRTPAPLLLTSTLFPVLGLLTAVVICAVMGRVARWRPGAPGGALVAVAVATGAALDLVCESVLLLTGLIAYPGTVGWLTLWPGTAHQFPLYEAVLLGTVWGIAGAVRYRLDGQGLSAVERGSPRRGRSAVRLLAVAGLLNVLFLGYALAFNAVSAHGDPVGDDRPSHLRSAGAPS
ncbi:spirocyclase AveC family protein [Streptomyces capparidis]